jgi:LysM repeat protein
MHLNNLFNETIRKEGDKYVVRSKKGKSMGSYDSKSAAEKRLRQVEMFKHMAESIKLSEAERDIQVEVPGIGVYTADTLSSNIIQSIDKLHRAAEAGDWEQVEYSLDPSKMGATLLTKAQALVQALKQNRLLEAEPVGTATYTTTGSGIVVPEPKQTKSSTYQNIADMNKIVDANKIKVGQKIKLPDGSSYKVQKGDPVLIYLLGKKQKI